VFKEKKKRVDVNFVYVGSESELDIFEAVDKKRKEDELVFYLCICLGFSSAYKHTYIINQNAQ